MRRALLDGLRLLLLLGLIGLLLLLRLRLILLLWLVIFSVELAGRILARRSERKMANELIAPANSMTQSDERQIQEAFAKAVQALQQDYNTRHGRCTTNQDDSFYLLLVFFLVVIYRL